MWAQDAAAMYGYAANSAATTAKVTPFTAAPQTTNQAGCGRAERPGRRHVDWHGRAVHAVTADVLDTNGATEPRVAQFVDVGTSGSEWLLDGLPPDPDHDARRRDFAPRRRVLARNILDGVITEYAVIPAWAAISGGSTRVRVHDGAPYG